MEDSAILDLYFNRNEMALVHTAQKYGRYCRAIANNLLAEQDAEECVNDTWLHSWRAIPPARPTCLRVWLGRVCRNLALDRLRRLGAAKRDAATQLLDELAECLPGGESAEDAFDAAQTGRIISRFLQQQCTDTERTLFLRRYWYGDSVAASARHCGLPLGTAKSSLSRTRAKLKIALEQEGTLL